MGMNVHCRNSCEVKRMTRKQAVLEAITILSQNEENVNIVLKLQDILEELPLSSWTKKSIIDTIENYAIEHDNRLPYERELTTENHMPSNTVIYNKFGIKSLREFYAKHFPDFTAKALYGTPYCDLTQEDFRNIFTKNYNRIKNELQVKNVTNKLYNIYKEEKSPCAETIMRNCNCATYNDILILCNIKNKNEPLETHLTITYNDDDRWDEDIDKLLQPYKS